MPLIKEEYETNILSIVNRNFNYSHNAEKSIRDIISRWSINKEFIYNLFGDKEIISSDILELQNEEEDIVNFFKIFKENLYKYFNSIYMLNIFLKFLKEAVELDGFKTNRVLKDWSYEGEGITLSISKGIKFSKAIKFFFDENSSRNELQNYYSTFSQTMYSKKKGCIKLSIHPYDFLSISDNDRDWDSCHSIYNGDYRVGNLNYMADGVTLVAYYITEDDNYDRLNEGFGNILSWNSKVWRMLVHIRQENDKIFIAYNKQYPYYSFQFLTEVDNMIQNLFQNKEFSPLKRYDEEKDNVCKQAIFTCQYNDIKRPKTFCRYAPYSYNLKDFCNFITIGEPVLCLQCGEEIAIETKEGTCDNCTIVKNTCELCHREWDVEDLYYLASEGMYICPDCLEEYYTYCEGCGEYIRKEDVKYKNGKGYCKKYFEEEA